MFVHVGLFMSYMMMILEGNPHLVKRMYNGATVIYKVIQA